MFSVHSAAFATCGILHTSVTTDQLSSNRCQRRGGKAARPWTGAFFSLTRHQTLRFWMCVHVGVCRLFHTPLVPRTLLPHSFFRSFLEKDKVAFSLTVWPASSRLFSFQLITVFFSHHWIAHFWSAVLSLPPSTSYHSLPPQPEISEPLYARGRPASRRLWLGSRSGGGGSTLGSRREEKPDKIS